MKRILIAIIVFMLIPAMLGWLAGCSGVHTFPDGSQVKWHTPPFAPSVTIYEQHGWTVAYAFDHSPVNAIAPSAVTAAGNVAAANTFGSNLSPDETNVGGGNASASGGSAKGGASSAGAQAAGGRSESHAGSSSQSDAHPIANGGSGFGTATANPISESAGGASNFYRRKDGCE